MTLTLLAVVILSLTSSPIETKSYVSKSNKPTCTKAGLSCLDCWTSLNCIDIGNGELLPQIQTCPVGSSCKFADGECKDTGYYDCSETEKLQCHDEETFPNPYDCHKYFTCIIGTNNEWERHDGYCGEHHAYDPFRKQCSKKLINNVRCTSSVSICTNSTQMAHVTGNPSIYYQCSKESVTVGFNYLPQLYSCPYNYQFNGAECIDPSPSGLDDNGKCAIVDTFGNATDCQHFMTCNSIGSSPIIGTCPLDLRYDAIKKACIGFNCASCNAPL